MWTSCGAGVPGRSAAVGQVAPPKAQMLAKQDWRYVAGAAKVRVPWSDAALPAGLRSVICAILVMRSARSTFQ